MSTPNHFYGQSMDEIVFDKRNKNYGAYLLRSTYNLHLGKALFLSTAIFVLLLFSPKIAARLGIFKSEVEIPPIETIFTFENLQPPIPFIKTEIEQAAQPATPTTDNREMKPVTPDQATSSPATTDELKNTTSSTVTSSGGGPPTGTQTSTQTVIQPVITNTTAVATVDQKATFIGGDEAFQAFITENIIYPKIPKENLIEGITGVSFVVTEEGRVENVRVSQSSGCIELDEEAVRVVKKTSKKYRPGKSGGMDVRSFCQVQIAFELTDEE